MKRTIKKMIACMLSAVFVCAFAAGCDNGTGGGALDKEGNTVVKIMFHVDSSSDEGIAYKKRVDEFNKAYAEKKIKATAKFKARTEGASGYETELINNKVEGTLADIITFDAPNCAAYADAELLYNITSLVPADVKSDFISVNEYNGNVYGLPIQESSAGFYYNKIMFREAGIDVSSYTVENPWTFEQFVSVCKKLKDSGKTAVDMRLYDTKSEMATYLLYPLIYAAGGSYTSADGLTATGYLNSDKSVAGFQFIKDLVSAGYTSNAIGSADFYNGKVGMYLSSGWTIPDIENKYTQVFKSREDWGILPYPKGERAASATGSWSYGITDNGNNNKDAAKELLLWMASADSAKVITDATGMIPARKSVETNYAAGSAEDVLLNQLMTTGTARPATIAYPKLSDNFRQIIGQLSTTDNLKNLVDTKTSDLQTELNRFKK